jgi:nucleoside-diphosphate-sugar epimerase
MKAIIIGHEGMIGKELCKQFPHEYIGVGRKDSIWDDRKSLDDVKEKVDFIVHLASNCIIRDVIKEPFLALENILTNYKVFEYARNKGIKKIIYFSSSRVTHEERNPYTTSKLLGEELCKSYNQCYGIDYLIIRPETVWSMDDKHNRVITSWINKAKNNEDIIVYGNENKELSPIHVKPFVEEYLKWQELFLRNDICSEQNISGEVMTVKEITDILKRKYNSDSKVIYKESEKAQPQYCNKDGIKIKGFEEYLE